MKPLYQKVIRVQDELERLEEIDKKHPGLNDHIVSKGLRLERRLKVLLRRYEEATMSPTRRRHIMKNRQRLRRGQKPLPWRGDKRKWKGR